jgi:hypothetical protein
MLMQILPAFDYLQEHNKPYLRILRAFGRVGLRV